jgi:8-oxo-dGTP pyrophosphatase MutT (NUDIX family)
LGAAIRETREEVGLDLGSRKYVDKIRLPSGTYFVYLLDDKPELKTQDATEVLEARWVPLKSIRSLRLNMDLNTIVATKLRRLQEHLQIETTPTPGTPRNTQTPLNSFIAPSSSGDEPTPLAV